MTQKEQLEKKDIIQANNWENETNKELLDNFSLINLITEILQENEDNFIIQENRIIIPSQITNKILGLFHKDKIDDEFKKYMKAILKKFFALNFKSAVLFKDNNIYIIKARLDISRFNWFSKEDIEFTLSEIIKNEYSINDIINKAIRKLRIKDLSKEELKRFIEWEYKNKILEVIGSILQNITSEDIDENIIKWVAGKIFRDNYDKILEKVTFNILSHRININEAINNSVNKLINSKFKLETEGIFLELNKKLERLLLKELHNEIENQLEDEIKVWINEDILKRTIRNLILKRALVVFSNKFSNHIFNSLENNTTNPKVLKNIDSFLSYYSWKTEIVWNKQFVYPKITVNRIREIIHEINYNHKTILNKTLEYIRNKKRKEQELKKEEQRKQEAIERNKKLEKQIKEKKQEIKQFEYEIESIKREIVRNNNLIKKIIEENEKDNSILNTAINSIWLDPTTKKIEKINNTIEQLKIDLSVAKSKKRFTETQLKDLEIKKIDIEKINKRINSIKEQIKKINNILNNFQLDLRDTFKQRKKVVN